jgi:hypothetical protein
VRKVSDNNGTEYEFSDNNGTEYDPYSFIYCSNYNLLVIFLEYFRRFKQDYPGICTPRISSNDINTEIYGVFLCYANEFTSS